MGAVEPTAFRTEETCQKEGWLPKEEEEEALHGPAIFADILLEMLQEQERQCNDCWRATTIAARPASLTSEEPAKAINRSGDSLAVPTRAACWEPSGAMEEQDVGDGNWGSSSEEDQDGPSQPQQQGGHLCGEGQEAWIDQTAARLLLKAMAPEPLPIEVEPSSTRNPQRGLQGKHRPHSVEPADHAVVEILGRCARGHRKHAELWLAKSLADDTLPTSACFEGMVHLCLQVSDEAAAMYWLMKMIEQVGLEPSDDLYALVRDPKKVSPKDLAAARERIARLCEFHPTREDICELVQESLAFGDLVEAEQWMNIVVNEDLEPDAVLYERLVLGLVASGDLPRAGLWLTRMLRAGFKLNTGSREMVLKACIAGAAHQPAAAARLICETLEHGQRPCFVTLDSLFQVLLFARDVVGAQRLLEAELEEVAAASPNGFTLTVPGLCDLLYSLLRQLEGPRAAGDALLSMLQKGLEPEARFFEIVLDGYAARMDNMGAERWLAKLLASGLAPEASSLEKLSRLWEEKGMSQKAEFWMSMSLQGKQKVAELSKRSLLPGPPSGRHQISLETAVPSKNLSLLQTVGSAFGKEVSYSAASVVPSPKPSQVMSQSAHVGAANQIVSQGQPRKSRKPVETTPQDASSTLSDDKSLRAETKSRASSGPCAGPSIVDPAHAAFSARILSLAKTLSAAETLNARSGEDSSNMSKDRSSVDSTQRASSGSVVSLAKSLISANISTGETEDSSTIAVSSQSCYKRSSHPQKAASGTVLSLSKSLSPHAGKGNTADARQAVSEGMSVAESAKPPRARIVREPAKPEKRKVCLDLCTLVASTRAVEPLGDAHEPR